MQASPTSGRRLGRKKVISVVAAVSLVAAICAGITTAATTISPVLPGNVVRDSSITITTNPVAVQFGRTLATSNFTRTAPLLASCAGDNPAGTNLSPRTIVDLIGPGSTGTVFNAVSPVIQRDLGGAIAGYPVVNPQPAPSNTNYRGGAHGSTVSGAPSAGNNTRPWTVTASLEGLPAGTYTVRTTTINMVRTGAGACTVGTPPQTSPTAFGNTFTPGPIVDNQTFEYRPWQHVFTDVFGNGSVSMNLAPKEFQAKIGAIAGQIYAGTNSSMRFFSLNGRVGAPGADPVPVMLPADPTGCATDPNSCIPSNAQPCDPGTGCVVRLVVINKGLPGDIVQGVFDTLTGAFIARVGIEGSQRIMMSLGTANDAAYRDILSKLAAAANAQGIDLMSLLATKVRVRLNATQITLSLLNGLQIDPNTAPNGVQIVSDVTAQAGLILNIYAKLDLSGPPCAANVGDSDPNTPAPDRYTRTQDAGYTVEKSDLLPEIPRVGAAGALVGGPIYHIEGDFVGAGTLLNTSTAVIGVDTAADEPNGYPVWVEPFLSSPAHVTAARTMDFIGTATWSASETPISATAGCLVIDFMLGAGVAIYNNPLPVGFGDVPVWDPASPEVQALMAQINAAVQDVVGTVAENPTVADLLDQVLETVLGGAEVPGGVPLP